MLGNVISVGLCYFSETLGLFDESTTPSTSLYNELGFTQYEVNQIQTSPDPFTAMLMQFMARRGTPSEFIHRLYSCKRRQNLDWLMNGTDSCDWSIQSQLSSESNNTVNVSDDDLTEAVLLTPPKTPRKRG